MGGWVYEYYYPSSFSEEEILMALDKEIDQNGLMPREFTYVSSDFLLMEKDAGNLLATLPKQTTRCFLIWDLPTLLPVPDIFQSIGLGQLIVKNYFPTQEELSIPLCIRKDRSIETCNEVILLPRPGYIPRKYKDPEKYAIFSTIIVNNRLFEEYETKTDAWNAACNGENPLLRDIVFIAHVMKPNRRDWEYYCFGDLQSY
jgi:hypothetical protein